MFQSKFHGWNKKLSTEPTPPDLMWWHGFVCFAGLASPKLNIAPGNPWLEDESPLGPGLSSWAMLVFGECIGVVAISCSESVP